MRGRPDRNASNRKAVGVQILPSAPSLPSTHYCLVTKLFELILQIPLWHDLHHEDADHVFFRVDPKRGARSTPPVILAFRTDGPRLFDSEIHRECETETIADSAVHVIDGGDIAKQIGTHEFYRLRAQDAYAIQLATVQKHLDEPGVVGGCRHQPAAAHHQNGPTLVALLIGAVRTFGNPAEIGLI